MNLGEKYYARIQLWGKTKEDWTNENPILRLNEMGIETDTNRFKFGDGSTKWSALSYWDQGLPSLGFISTSNINKSISLYASDSSDNSTITNNSISLVSNSGYNNLVINTNKIEYQYNEGYPFDTICLNRSGLQLRQAQEYDEYSVDYNLMSIDYYSSRYNATDYKIYDGSIYFPLVNGNSNFVVEQDGQVKIVNSWYNSNKPFAISWNTEENPYSTDEQKAVVGFSISQNDLKWTLVETYNGEINTTETITLNLPKENGTIATKNYVDTQVGTRLALPTSTATFDRIPIIKKNTLGSNASDFIYTTIDDIVSKAKQRVTFDEISNTRGGYPIAEGLYFLKCNDKNYKIRISDRAGNAVSDKRGTPIREFDAGLVIVSKPWDYNYKYGASFNALDHCNRISIIGISNKTTMGITTTDYLALNYTMEDLNQLYFSANTNNTTDWLASIFIYKIL